MRAARCCFPCAGWRLTHSRARACVRGAGRFAHCVCVIWNYRPTFVDVVAARGGGGPTRRLAKLSEATKDAKDACVYCKRRGGGHPVIKCCADLCGTSYHPMCAFLGGAVMDAAEGGAGGGGGGLEMYSLCEEHRTAVPARERVGRPVVPARRASVRAAGHDASGGAGAGAGAGAGRGRGRSAVRVVRTRGGATGSGDSAGGDGGPARGAAGSSAGVGGGGGGAKRRRGTDADAGGDGGGGGPPAQVPRVGGPTAVVLITGITPAAAVRGMTDALTALGARVEEEDYSDEVSRRRAGGDAVPCARARVRRATRARMRICISRMVRVRRARRVHR